MARRMWQHGGIAMFSLFGHAGHAACCRDAPLLFAESLVRFMGAVPSMPSTFEMVL